MRVEWRCWILAAALLSLPGGAGAANFASLDVTADPLWVRYLIGISASGSTLIEAPAGQTPSQLSGTVGGGDFSADVDASVLATSDSITLVVTGNATSFEVPGSDEIRVELGDTTEIQFQSPPSAQSVVQVFLDWSITASPGWRAEAVADGTGPQVDGLGNVGAYFSAASDQPATSYPVPLVGTFTIPAGESVRVRPSIALILRAIDATPGPFNATATLRLRVSLPLPLGDSNADGTADLVDVVILRRQLAGLAVP